VSSWAFVYEGFDPEEEKLREALCTLGNGYFATRGAAPESEADEVHYPGTYLACGYNRLETPKSGRTIENEDLVNLPNWLCLSFRISGGEWFRLADVDILSYTQRLDLKTGVLRRDLRFRDPEDRETHLEERRLVHMTQPHLAALEWTLTAENWSGPVEFRTAVDGSVVNDGVPRYRGLNNKHLHPLEAEWVDEETVFLKVETVQSELRVAQAARTRIFDGGASIDASRRELRQLGYIGQVFVIDVSEGRPITIEKVVSLYTSRDHAISECGLEARKTAADAGKFDDLLETHVLGWKHLWSLFELKFELEEGTAKDRTAMILNLYTFHLLQTTSTNTMDLDVGVPSRGWHGEAYRGHIFWDELFIFPFLNLRVPEITRALLMYRYRRLDEARANARQAGYRGAMFPWQSGSNGREESQELHLNPKSGRWIPDNSHLQRHVNAAIAFNVSKYYESTGDKEFLSFYGAEMILEIARFWASIATYNSHLERYEILGVMGPDEYHEGYPGADRPGLDNNAYTNLMAVWVLREAINVFRILPEDRGQEIRETMGIQEEEIERWDDISRNMRLVFHGDGIISQFEGYEELEEFDWDSYREKYGDIQRLDRILEAEEDTPNRYKASKQADVLMLFYLFSSEELGELFDRLDYPFEYETIPKNIDYYIQRTSHGSTLSRVVHSWVLARSDRPRSWKLFCEALKSDVADIQGGTTPEGIHLGAMSGVINIVQEGFTGIEIRGDVLRFNPRLPEEVARLSMEIRYRGHKLDVEIVSDRLTVTACRCAEEPIVVAFREEPALRLQQGESQSFHLS
jgi:alpha,alpha-trehalase